MCSRSPFYDPLVSFFSPLPRPKHWSGGALGYFPTYSLGAMAATQIYAKAASEIPSLEADLAAGKFAGLKGWLNERVHRLGSLYPSGDELLKAVTGEPLNPQLFLAHLKKKYGDLYGLAD